MVKTKAVKQPIAVKQPRAARGKKVRIGLIMYSILLIKANIERSFFVQYLTLTALAKSKQS